MSTGKHLAKFQFEVVGFGRTQGPAIFESDDQRVRISFESNDVCRLEISLEGSADPKALAARIADAFYERFLLAFGKQIESSSSPHPEGQHSLELGCGKYRMLFSVDPADVVPLLHRVVMEVQAGQPPFAAALYSARKMYRVALESSDEVVSYLILYSALGLASLFKFGPKGGNQEALDRWIIEEVPSIRRFSVTRSGRSKPTIETLYTYCRNQLIHAEDRGADPAGAIAEIHTNLVGFRELVAVMLGKL